MRFVQIVSSVGLSPGWLFSNLRLLYLTGAHQRLERRAGNQMDRWFWTLRATAQSSCGGKQIVICRQELIFITQLNHICASICFQLKEILFWFFFHCCCVCLFSLCLSSTPVRRDNISITNTSECSRHNHMVVYYISDHLTAPVCVVHCWTGLHCLCSQNLRGGFCK